MEDWNGEKAWWSGFGNINGNISRNLMAVMIGISHDVKTLLVLLVGYLEAIECEIILGQGKEEYIHVAYEKAHYLK